MTDEKDIIAAHVVRCPRCRKSTRYDATNPSRPFCSAACKDDDIIAWAEEDYKVPGKPGVDDKEEGETEDDV